MNMKEFDELHPEVPEKLQQEIAASQERVKAFKKGLSGALNSYDTHQSEKLTPEWRVKTRKLVDDFMANVEKNNAK